MITSTSKAKAVRAWSPAELKVLPRIFRNRHQVKPNARQANRTYFSHEPSSSGGNHAAAFTCAQWESSEPGCPAYILCSRERTMEPRPRLLSDFLADRLACALNRLACALRN